MRKLSTEQKTDRKKILEITHQARTSHLGSCLSAVDAISAIYKVKRKDERFVLSEGHAGVALYVVLERKGLLEEANLSSLHVHPDRDPKKGIDITTGSLGHGLPVAVGMALGAREKNVYCLISDGETTEGSIWEAVRIAAQQQLTNLKIVVNANGWGAYGQIDIKSLSRRFKGFGCQVTYANGHNIAQLIGKLKAQTEFGPLVIIAHTTVEQFSFLLGQDAHYKIMSDDDYKEALKELG